jgi:hypothetical protein
VTDQGGASPPSPPPSADARQGDARPAPGSHDRSVPTGSLETSAAAIYEAAEAARAAQVRGDRDGGALAHFYRTLASSTLLLPLAPGTGDGARQALERAVSDSEEVEIAVMLARDADGGSINVMFSSPAALAAWAPVGSSSLPLPGRIVLGNLAASRLPAVLDPAGPIPYRFDVGEIAALAAGRLPESDEPLFGAANATSIRVRLPAQHTGPLEESLRGPLRGTGVEEAYLVESDDGGGRSRLMLGLVGEPGASVTLDVPERTEVVWLEGPLLAAVRAVADPFFRERSRARR